MAMPLCMNSVKKVMSGYSEAIACIASRPRWRTLAAYSTKLVAASRRLRYLTIDPR